MNLIRRLAWPPIAAVLFTLAALVVATWLPGRFGLVLAFGCGAITFAVLSLRDAATRDMEN